MSVILDALKKAQNDRKDLAKGLPYEPKNRPQRPRWPVYLIASLAVSVLIVFLLIPGPKKPTITISETPKIAQVTPASPPVVTEKTPPVVQSKTPVHVSLSPKQSTSTRKISTKEIKPAKDQKKRGDLSSKNETEKKDAGAPDLSLQTMPKAGSQVLISSIDNEKINATYNEALKETERGNTKGAKRLYQTILEEQPSHIEALNNLGVIAMKEGVSDEALFYFNKVLQYKKDYGKAYNNIGLLMMKEGKKGLAEEYFRKSIELGKDSMEPSLNLAALLRTEKRYEEAGRILAGLIGANIRNKSLFLSYALIKDEMGQYDEAIKYYKLYLREGGGAGERNEVVERIKALESVHPTKNKKDGLP
jgi:Tfp pilus assembly protein PilF